MFSGFRSTDHLTMPRLLASLGRIPRSALAARAYATAAATATPTPSTSAPKKRRRLVFNNRHGPGLAHFLSESLVPDPAALSARPDDVPYLPVSDWGEGRAYYIEVYGCQMNVSDTEVLMAVLNKSGYRRTTELADADIIFLMTCAVRDKAEERVWGRLADLKGRRTKMKARPPTVGVLGCMAERLKEKLLDRGADVVCGPDAYRSLPRLLSLRALGADGVANVMLSADETYADITPVRMDDKNPHSAYVSVMRGCNNMCAFCIVPFTRGAERSRDIDSVVAEVRRLAAAGVKEVTLLGQNVNSYRDTSESAAYALPAESGALSDGFRTIYSRKEGGRRFADLVAAVAQVDPELRVRFTSPHPKDFPDELLAVIRDYPNVCRRVHLPLQSGSTATLERMRRGYSREAFVRLAAHIRAAIPDVALSTDVIAGFCGESEGEHTETVEVMREVGFESAFMFAYSMREKTHAHRKFEDDVPQPDKDRRLREIMDTFFARAGERNAALVGSLQLVLYSGLSKGRHAGTDDGGRRVFIADGECLDQLKPGDYVAVHVHGSSNTSLTGTALGITTLQRFYQEHPQPVGAPLAIS
jgi:MiaB/RimO family radical SAM methylthiotransferase